MTRQKKIEALAEEFCKAKFCYAGEKELAHYFKAGALAGIRLRDEELLAMEFDGDAATDYWLESPMDISLEEFRRGAKYQHEQFMKLLKGDGDVGI